MLELIDVRKEFSTKAGVLRALTRGSDTTVRAVDGVDLRVEDHEILGIAGESGSGKSTLGEIAIGLVSPSHGSVAWNGTDLSSFKGADRAHFRRNAQMVFQDPFATLNPRFTTYRSVVEPVIAAGIRDRSNRLVAVETALTRCGLEASDTLLAAYPHELSGGQRQRIAIARAIVMEPSLLVADEPVSMLDASIRSGILNLLLSLRDSLELTIIYISHDLASVRYLCDRMAVMYLGKVVELGPAKDLVETAQHPYTRALLRSVPDPDANATRATAEIGQRAMSSVHLPTGCRFAPRCPFAQQDCRAREPSLAELTPAHHVRCVHPQSSPVWTQ